MKNQAYDQIGLHCNQFDFKGFKQFEGRIWLKHKNQFKLPKQPFFYRKITA